MLSSSASSSSRRDLRNRGIILNNRLSSFGHLSRNRRPDFFDPTTVSGSNTLHSSRVVCEPLSTGTAGRGCVVGDGGRSNDFQLKIRKQLQGDDISFVHTMFVVVVLLLFTVYFVGFVHRMRTAMSNVTNDCGGGGGGGF